MYIGILLRKQVVDDRLKYTLNGEIVNMLIAKGCIPIGINTIDSIKLCDGIILQGGSDYDLEDINFVQYLYDYDIPTLGICLGMQMMSVMKNGKIDFINSNTHNFNDEYVHVVKIKKNTKLYQILNKDYILVNSRHLETIVSTDLDISAISTDGLIEAVEDKNKRFFLGVQWHPESLIDKDIYSNLLIDAFLNNCNKK